MYPLRVVSERMLSAAVVEMPLPTVAASNWVDDHGALGDWVGD